MVGKQKMLEILHTYFERYKFRHVDQYAFQSVAEEVTGRDLDWFFGEWLHTNGVVDYALQDVETRRDGDGWVTDIRIARNGGLRMPVPIRLEAGGEARDTVVPGDAVVTTHRVRTSFRPEQVELDPRLVIMDWNALNNTWPAGLLSGNVYATALDNPFSALPAYRDRAALRLFPLAWANDAGGIVGGLQARSAYMSDIRQVLIRLGFPAVEAADRGGASDALDPGSIYFRLDNPILFDRPRYGMSVEAFAGEGRGLFRVAGERDVSPWPLSAPRRAVRASMTMAALYDSRYVVPGRWTPSDHVAAEVGVGFRSGGGALSSDLGGSTGVSTDGRGWFRGVFTSELTTSGRSGWDASMRLFAGALMAHRDGRWRGEAAPRERQFFISGGDPWAALVDPWFRSAGAPLDEEGWASDGGELLGYHPALSFAQLHLRLDLRSAPLALGSGRSRLEARARLFGGTGAGRRPAAVSGPRAVGRPGRHRVGRMAASVRVGRRGPRDRHARLAHAGALRRALLRGGPRAGYAGPGRPCRLPLTRPRLLGYR